MASLVETGVSAVGRMLRPGGTGRQISWSVGQSIFEAGSMMVASLLAARLFGTVAWGELGFILVGVQLISMASDGILPGIVRTVAKYCTKGEFEGILAGQALARKCLQWAAGLGCVFLVAALVWNFQWGQTSSLWLIAGAILAIGRIARTIYDSICRGIQAFKIPAKAGIVCTGGMASSIIVATLLGYRVGAYLYIMTFWIVVNVIWLVVALKGKLSYWSPARPVLEPGEDRQFFTYSAPLIVRGIFVFLFLKINVALIGVLGEGNADAAGQFRLTDQFLTVPSLLLASATSVFAPKVVPILKSPLELSQLLAKMYGFLFLFNLPFVIFFLLGTSVLRLLFPDYHLVPEMNLYFAPAVLAQSFAYGAVTVLLQAGHSKLAFWLAAIPSILNVFAAFIGMQFYGVMGLVGGTAIVHFIAYVAAIAATHRTMQLPFLVRFW